MVRKEKGNHNLVAVLAEDGTKEISKLAWNDGHDETGMLGFASQTPTITISSGALLATDSLTVAAAETGTADTLDTITTTNMNDDDEIRLFADTGDTITVTHEAGGAGQIHLLGGEAKIASQTVPILLTKKGADLYEFGGGGGDSGTITHKFTASETFNAISGLSAEAIKVIHVKTTSVTVGSIKVEVDGVEVLSVASGVSDTSLIIAPSSKVDVIASPTDYEIASSSLVQSSTQLTGSQPGGMAFSSDGLTLMTVDDAADTITEWSMTTARDITSLTLVSTKTTQTTNPHDIVFNDTGSKLYVISTTGTVSTLDEYTLTTNYLLSSATFSIAKTLTTDDNEMKGLSWNGDGSKLFTVGNDNNKIYEYAASTNFLISSLSLTTSIGAGGAGTTGISISSDGLAIYVSDSSANDITYFKLTTSNDLSTATEIETFNIGGQDSSVQDVLIVDVSSFFIIGLVSDQIHQYTTNPFAGIARIVII